MLSFVSIFSLSPLLAFAQSTTIKVTDKETGLAVPYAMIHNADKSKVQQSNADGVFFLEISPSEIYTISQIGYNPITMTAAQLQSAALIQMEALSYELNPIVVRADAALKDIYRAIDSTHKRIYATPFYLRCYKRDEIFSDSKRIMDAKAIVDIKALRVRSAGKGTMVTLALKGLETFCDSDYTEHIAILNSNIYPYNPISLSNDFLVGHSKKDEKNLIFTRMYAEGDSIMIITYHPKSSYQYSGDFVYPSGRFIIDAKTWNILRIDMTLDNKAIAYQNHVVETSKAQKLMHERNFSIFLSANGLPFKTEQKIVYSLKTKPERFVWATLQVYKESTKAAYQQEPSGPYNQRAFILLQKPVTLSDFAAQYNRGFE